MLFGYFEFKIPKCVCVVIRLNKVGLHVYVKTRSNILNGSLLTGLLEKAYKHGCTY